MTDDGRAGLIRDTVQQSDLPVVLTTAAIDQSGPEIICVSDAYTHLTGYSRDELIGAIPWLCQGPATDRAVLDRLKVNLHAGIAFQGSTWNYRRDGAPYLEEWTVTPLRLTSGTIDYFFSIYRDITEQHPGVVAPIEYLETSLHAVRNHSDPVTGAQTRKSMLRCLQRAIDVSLNSGTTTGLIKLQLKRPDRLNKVFSLEAVNRLLWDIAERLAYVFEPDESLARSHEWTFAIITRLPVLATDDVGAYLMARAKTLITTVTAEPFTIGDETLHIEVGAGIGRAPVDSRDANDLVVLVDEAAQRADPQDDQTICWADHTVIEQESRQLTLERELRRAISENELEVHYQPVIDLTRNEIVGAEALARWPQPAGEPPIGPDEFIPLAESLGLIDRLGRRVFEQACRQLRKWQMRFENKGFWVSVNVAPRQLRDPNLADRLLGLARSMDVSPACLKLEITESALERDFDTVRGVIDDLVAVGFCLALDDFGKGHSSLERVIALPFSVLKVDRSFIWQTPNGPGRAVVAGVAEIIRHLELHALGEGVETAAHETFLQQYGYRYAQGYYYSKPVAASDFPPIPGTRIAHSR